MIIWFALQVGKMSGIAISTSQDFCYIITNFFLTKTVLLRWHDTCLILFVFNEDIDCLFVNKQEYKKLAKVQPPIGRPQTWSIYLVIPVMTFIITLFLISTISITIQ